LIRGLRYPAPAESVLRVNRLRDRLEALRRQMRELRTMERVVEDAPDHQVSLADTDARAMATNGKGTGMVKKSPSGRAAALPSAGPGPF
jgi:hypothetical protein